jgi:hypothetical protein
VAIVRPDKFVFALVPGRELAQATREVARQLHRDAAQPVPVAVDDVPAAWAKAT